MEFSISKGTKKFLIDLVYFTKHLEYKTYEQMLDILKTGGYDDERSTEGKVFNLFKGDK